MFLVVKLNFFHKLISHLDFLFFKISTCIFVFFPPEGLPIFLLIKVFICEGSQLVALFVENILPSYLLILF